MPRRITSLKRRWHIAEGKLAEARGVVFAYAPDATFPKAWRMAGESPAGAYVQDRFLAARTEVDRITAEAVALGKAYWTGETKSFLMWRH